MIGGGGGCRKFHDSPETLCSKVEKHWHFSKILLSIFIIKNLCDLSTYSKKTKINLKIAFHKTVLARVNPLYL